MTTKTTLLLCCLTLSASVFSQNYTSYKTGSSTDLQTSALIMVVKDLIFGTNLDVLKRHLPYGRS